MEQKPEPNSLQRKAFGEAIAMAIATFRHADLDIGTGDMLKTSAYIGSENCGEKTESGCVCLSEGSKKEEA